MKKITLFLLLFIALYGCKSQRPPMPYETTWLKLTETDSGYVVYNYPSIFYDEETLAPMSIAIQNDTIIWTTFHDGVVKLPIKKNSIQKRENGSYFFPKGNCFLFTWYDEENHIAQWKVYGDVENDDPLTDYLYVDSLHNPYPIVDLVWDDGPITGEAD